VQISSKARKSKPSPDSAADSNDCTEQVRPRSSSTILFVVYPRHDCFLLGAELPLRPHPFSIQALDLATNSTTFSDPSQITVTGGKRKRLLLQEQAQAQAQAQAHLQAFVHSMMMRCFVQQQQQQQQQQQIQNGAVSQIIQQQLAQQAQQHLQPFQQLPGLLQQQAQRQQGPQRQWQQQQLTLLDKITQEDAQVLHTQASASQEEHPLLPASRQDSCLSSNDATCTTSSGAITDAAARGRPLLVSASPQPAGQQQQQPQHLISCSRPSPSEMVSTPPGSLPCTPHSQLQACTHVHISSAVCTPARPRTRSVAHCAAEQAAAAAEAADEAVLQAQQVTCRACLLSRLVFMFYVSKNPAQWFLCHLSGSCLWGL